MHIDTVRMHKTLTKGTIHSLNPNQFNSIVYSVCRAIHMHFTFLPSLSLCIFALVCSQFAHKRFYGFRFSSFVQIFFCFVDLLANCLKTWCVCNNGFLMRFTLFFQILSIHLIFRMHIRCAVLLPFLWARKSARSEYT